MVPYIILYALAKLKFCGFHVRDKANITEFSLSDGSERVHYALSAGMNRRVDYAS